MEPPSPYSEQSTVVIPGFDVLAKIGQGGFSVVYRARQHSLNRDVAIKVLNTGFASDAERRTFVRECHVLGQLAHHPNIVTVFSDAMTNDGRPCIVMELYRSNYRDRLTTGGPLSPAEALSVGVRVCGALQTAHDAGVLHRDIKPHNIFVSAYGEPALGDFGISTMDDERSQSVLRGLSLAYSPPEVLDDGTTTVRSDIYSLGAALYQLLTGDAPFKSPEMSTTLRRILTEPPPAVGRADVPDGMDAVLSAALSKRPDDRPATALELAERLRDVQTAAGYEPTPISRTDSSVGPPPLGGTPTQTSPQQGVSTGNLVPPPRIMTVPAAPPTPPHATPPPPPPAAARVDMHTTDRSLPHLTAEDLTQRTVARSAGQPVPSQSPRVDATDTPRNRWIGWVVGGAAVLLVGVVIGLALVTRGGSSNDAGGGSPPPSDASDVTVERADVSGARDHATRFDVLFAMPASARRVEVDVARPQLPDSPFTGSESPIALYLDENVREVCVVVTWLDASNNALSTSDEVCSDRSIAHPNETASTTQQAVERTTSAPPSTAPPTETRPGRSTSPTSIDDDVEVFRDELARAIAADTGVIPIDDARCVGERLLDRVGHDRLLELGGVEMDELRPGEHDAVVDSFVECIDFVELMIDEAIDEGLDPDVARCLFGNIADDELDEMIRRDFIDPGGVTDDMADRLLEDLEECTS